MKQRADNRIAGFSLIEVIVGIAVLGLVTIPICASLVLSVRINSHSRDLMNAQLRAASAVETLMERGIDAGDGTVFHENGENSWVMDADDAPEGVTVTVEKENAADTWYTVTVVGEANGRTVELTTTIREGGGA